MTPAASAAVRVAMDLGLDVRDPVLLHETNNTVLWLQPEAVVAKVATRPDAMQGLRLEWRVATELAGLAAEIAAPLPRVGPTVHEPTGFVVTLWERVAGEPHVDVAATKIAQSLLRLHAALDRTDVPLPSFRSHLLRARTALDDDGFPAALPVDERVFLRSAFDDGLSRLDRLTLPERRLHGEPHNGNRLWTGTEIRWIDFEDCCTGPAEWDLAFQPEAFDHLFPDSDRDLLDLLRLLNSARVATWCWAQARFPEMRQHGDVHLRRLHARLGDGH
jgi:Ser/Thr protein kinase RdoA (MazF antagonist)